MSWDFYNDAGGQQVADPFEMNQVVAGAPVDRVIYYLNTVPGRKAQASSSPGVDQIEVFLVDTLPGQDGAASMIKLALSAGGLDSAVAGDPVSVGTQLLSGVGNAVPIYCRADMGLAPGSPEVTYDDIRLESSPILDTAL